MKPRRSSTPILDRQTRHRIEMRFVAGDQNQAARQRMTGNQHVRVMHILRRMQPHPGTGLRCGKIKVDHRITAIERTQCKALGLTQTALRIVQAEGVFVGRNDRDETPVPAVQINFGGELLPPRFSVADVRQDIGIEQKIAHATPCSFQSARTRRRVSGVSDFRNLSSAAPLRPPGLTAGALFRAGDLAVADFFRAVVMPLMAVFMVNASLARRLFYQPLQGGGDDVYALFYLTAERGIE